MSGPPRFRASEFARAVTIAASLRAAFLALVLVALVQPGGRAEAQVAEVEKRPEPWAFESEDERELEKVAAAARFEPPRGPVYTWRDGDRTLKVHLQEDLVVSRKGIVAAGATAIARTGNGTIVRVASASEVEGQPVFRSTSGALMTLPGGILLIFDPGWGEAESDRFFAANGIAKERLSPLGAIPNGFVVETEPGFASLNLANSLAGKAGVEVSSPNWWREIATK